MNFKFNSAMKKASIGFAAALVMLLIIAFLLFNASTGFFWVSALFLFFGYAAIYATVMFYLYDGKASFREYPANYPLIHIAVVYSIVQIIMVIIVALINSALKNGLSMRIYWAIELLLLLVFGISYAVHNSARRYSINLETKTKAKIYAIRMMTDKCMKVQQSVQELPVEIRAEVSREVHTMEEKIRYSDPMSHESLMDMDYDIEKGIDRVAVEVENLMADSSENLDALRREVRNVNNLVDSRNNRVKMLK